MNSIFRIFIHIRKIFGNHHFFRIVEHRGNMSAEGYVTMSPLSSTLDVSLFEGKWDDIERWRYSTLPMFRYTRDRNASHIACVLRDPLSGKDILLHEWKIPPLNSNNEVLLIAMAKILHCELVLGRKAPLSMEDIFNLSSALPNSAYVFFLSDGSFRLMCQKRNAFFAFDNEACTITMPDGRTDASLEDAVASLKTETESGRLIWARVYPTTVGFFWMQDFVSGHMPCMVQVFQHRCGQLYVRFPESGREAPLSAFPHVFWAGPVQEPVLCIPKEYL